MALYTVEVSWLVPNVLTADIDASSPEEAMAIANQRLLDDDYCWDAAELCYDASTTSAVTGLWAGSESYQGNDLRPAVAVMAQETDTAKEATPMVAKAFAGMLSALKASESFIAGFEGDPLQEGIDEMLAGVRAAIFEAEGL